MNAATMAFDLFLNNGQAHTTSLDFCITNPLVHLKHSLVMLWFYSWTVVSNAEDVLVFTLFPENFNAALFLLVVVLDRISN